MVTSGPPGRRGSRICPPAPFLGDASWLLRALPNLTALRLTGDALRLDDADAIPAGLRELTIETRFLRASTLEAIGYASLQALGSLELWLGNWPDSSPRFEGDEPEAYFGRRTGAGDLAGILSGKNLPNLRHLALTSCAWMGDCVYALAESAIAPQLTSIDLSYGFMNASEVRPLLAARRRFSSLRRIDLSYNQIDAPEVQRELAAAYGTTLLFGKQDPLAGNPLLSLFAYDDDEEDEDDE
jgi:hypothetical protein